MAFSYNPCKIVKKKLAILFRFCFYFCYTYNSQMLAFLSSISSHRYIVSAVPPPPTVSSTNGWACSVVPADSALKVHYTFDNTANDSSGNSYHGTAVLSPFSADFSRYGTHSIHGNGASNGGDCPAFLLPTFGVAFTKSLGCSFSFGHYHVRHSNNFNYIVIEFGLDSAIERTYFLPRCAPSIFKTGKAGMRISSRGTSCASKASF